MDDQEISKAYMDIIRDIDLEGRETILAEHNDAISAFSYVALGAIANATAMLGPAAAPMLATSIKAHMTLLFALAFEAGVEYGKLEHLMHDLDVEPEEKGDE